MGNNTGVTPNGVQRGWVDTLRPLTVPSAGRGALVGRIGNSDAATPFLVGADGTVLVPFSGRLYLGINQDHDAGSRRQISGTYRPHRGQHGDLQRRGCRQEQLRLQAAVRRNSTRSLPYRVTDKPEGGNPGDLVNFVIVGSQEQVTKALKDAGWLPGRQDQH